MFKNLFAVKFKGPIIYCDYVKYCWSHLRIYAANLGMGYGMRVKKFGNFYKIQQLFLQRKA